MTNPWENRRPHDAIYPIGQPPTTQEQEEEELAMLAQGERGITCTGEPAEPEHTCSRGPLCQGWQGEDWLECEHGSCLLMANEDCEGCQYAAWVES